jgi:hypothetical protein
MNDDDREVQQYLEEQQRQYLETTGENQNEQRTESVRSNLQCDF